MTCLRINADDFGMSPGANFGIEEALRRRAIDSVSFMVNTPYSGAALEIQKEFPDVQCGIHLNFAYGRALSGIGPLTDSKGLFKYGFSGYLINSRRLVAEIRCEAELQINWLTERGIKISHIDSHRHIHMIPAFYNICRELARNYAIPHIRVMNEPFRLPKSFKDYCAIIRSGGLPKWFILQALCHSFRQESKEQFYSILYTGQVTETFVKKIAAIPGCKEVMVHPGHGRIDRAADFTSVAEKKYRVDSRRDLELDACIRFAEKGTN